MNKDLNKDLKIVLDLIYTVKCSINQTDSIADIDEEIDESVGAVLELYSAAVENKPIVLNFPGTSPLILEKGYKFGPITCDSSILPLTDDDLPHEETPEEKARKNFDKLISRNKERFFDMSLKKSLMKEDD